MSLVTEDTLNAAADGAVATIDLASLHTEDPGTDRTTGELVDDSSSAPGYARQAIAWAAASSAVSGNDGAVDFAADGGDWPEVTHIGLWEDDTTPIFRGSVALATARQINDGATLRFASGTITLTAAEAEVE